MSEAKRWLLEHQFAELTDQAVELGLDWHQLPIDTENHLRAAIMVLAQWISCRKGGRQHWLDGPHA